MKIVLGISLILIAQISSAQIYLEKLTLKKENPTVTNAPLFELKKAEEQRKWQSCSEKAKYLFAVEAKLRGWVALTWLRCSKRLAEDKRNFLPLLNAVNEVFAKQELFVSGAWKQDLFTEWSRSQVLLIEDLVSVKSDKTNKAFDNILMFQDRLDSETKAKLYFFAGEWAQTQRNILAAEQFYYQSLNEKENKNTREKYQAVLLALNQNTETPTAAIEQIPEGEKKFDERWQTLQKSRDWLALLDEGVLYLDQFPNGKYAKFISDRVLDIYQDIKSSKENNEVLVERALQSLMKAEAQRVLEWTRVLHRKSDFYGCSKLGEKVANEFAKKILGAQALYLAGRCAQFVGNWSHAEKFFQNYLDNHSGAEDVNEVMFRLALIYLRKNQYGSAIATLERLLQKGTDRYELNSRYWLVRSLQEQKNSRAEEEIQYILDRYPFSYYGIRLRSERQAGVFDWGESQPNLKSNMTADKPWVLTSAHKKILERAEKLSAHGWTTEALKEISELPLPRSGVQKIILANNWQKKKLFPVVIRLINEASDLDPEYRQMQWLSMGYPKPFESEIQNQAKILGISSILIRSLIRQESAFATRAISTSNALGLMQMIPPTAHEVAQNLKLNIQIPEDVFDPATNIQMGSSYLSQLLRQFKSHVPLALASYNAGPHRMKMFIDSRPEIQSKPSSSYLDEIWFDEIPWSETSFYVEAILRNTLIYKALDQGRVQMNDLIWQDLVSTSTEVVQNTKSKRVPASVSLPAAKKKR